MSRNRSSGIITVSQESDWLNELENNLSKSAVQPMSQDSLYDQINNVMNGGTRSKFNSVDDVVADMQARSGLTAYLSKVSETDQAENGVKKTASNHSSFLSENPEVIQTINNIISSSKGNLPVPAIINRVKSLHKNDVKNLAWWEDDRLVEYVTYKNLEEKSKVTTKEDNNLGKLDNSDNDNLESWNTDAFFGVNC